MSKLISILIPTFNRAPYLQEALESIVAQFAQTDIADQTEVIILDNISDDNTEEVARRFVGRYPNIRYVKDSERRKILPAFIKIAALGTGRYLWIFSDDDVQRPGCLQRMMAQAADGSPDLIIGNVDGLIGKDNIYRTDLLAENTDRFFSDRRSFFAYLSGKFPLTVDYYTTYCSNWILKKDFYDRTKRVFDVYNHPRLDMFPFPSLVFYSDEEFSTAVVADSYVLFRADNASWGHKDPIRHQWYKGQLWRHHYSNIIKHNAAVLPTGFRIKVALKNALRAKEWLTLLSVLSLKKLGLFDAVRKLIKKNQ